MPHRVRRLSGLTRRQTGFLNGEVEVLWERLGPNATDTSVFESLREQHRGLVEIEWAASYSAKLKHIRDLRPELSRRSPQFRARRSKSLARMFALLPSATAELGRLARGRREAQRRAEEETTAKAEQADHARSASELLDFTAHELEIERRLRSIEGPLFVWSDRRAGWLSARRLLSERLLPLALTTLALLIVGISLLEVFRPSALLWWVYLAGVGVALVILSVLAIVTSRAGASDPSRFVGPLLE